LYIIAFYGIKYIVINLTLIKDYYENG